MQQPIPLRASLRSSVASEPEHGSSTRSSQGRDAKPSGVRRKRAGYTVVEVMMSLAVLAVGGAGIIAMQRATLAGNVRARDLATANAVAAAWAERLRTDGLIWTDIGGTPNVTSTQWLGVVGTDFPTIVPNERRWLRPAAVAALGISPMANVQGMDTLVDADAAFCTHVRLTQLLPTMIRAEIRVFWLRGGHTGGTVDGGVLCPVYVEDTSDPVGAARDRYHFVYLTTAIMRNDSAR